MSQFSADRTSSLTWWEIQHSYAERPDRWASTDLAQFGDEAVRLLRAAVEAGTFEGFVGDRRFRSEADASRYLIEFARLAVCHKSTSFRVVRVVASISMEVALEVTPPKVCGVFGYYGVTRRTEDLYCQKTPGHNGDHGPRRKAKAAA